MFSLPLQFFQIHQPFYSIPNQQLHHDFLSFSSWRSFVIICFIVSLLSPQSLHFLHSFSVQNRFSQLILQFAIIYLCSQNSLLLNFNIFGYVWFLLLFNFPLAVVHPHLYPSLLFPLFSVCHFLPIAISPLAYIKAYINLFYNIFFFFS